MRWPTKVDATWSGERPMKPQCSAAHVCSDLRRCTISAWLRGSCQQRFTRRFEPSGVKVIASAFSSRAWKSYSAAAERTELRNAGCSVTSSTSLPSI